MLKNFKNLSKSIKSSIVFVVILIFATGLFRAYTIRNIDYKYRGIKYQTGNLKYEKPINIEIKGKYVKGIFSPFDKFYGEIIVEDMVFHYSNFTQQVYNYKKVPLILESGNKGLYGDVFYSNVFKQITIPIREQEGSNKYSWNNRDGWLISAPCKDRKQAVELSNVLIPKQYRGGYSLE